MLPKANANFYSPGVAILLFAAFAFTAIRNARADFLFASDLTNAQIYKVDKTTGALLQTIPVSQSVDSLVFDTNGNIIYSAYSAGQIRRVNPNIGVTSDVTLSAVGGEAVDLAISPNGNFVLGTSQSTGKIYKVDLTSSGIATTTYGTGQYSGGIIYDNVGRLFAVSNSNIVELDPTTFSVLATSAGLTGLDGLTYDPTTDSIFASSRTVNGSSGREGFYQLSLASGSFLSATLITKSSFSSTFDPDGLEADGHGNVYFASEDLRGDNRIYQYGIATGVLTPLTAALPGLDDIAPLAGAGSLPEPSSLAVLAIGSLALLRRRRCTS